MSQKRRSCGLGTRLAGLSADSLRINAPRFCTNWSSTASAGMRTVWSPVRDLPPEPGVPVPFQRPGDRVQVDHHLDGVAGAIVPGLGVDDDRLIVPPRDQVWLARQRCGSAAELEAVLPLDAHAEAANLLVGSPLLDECRVVEHPLGVVEVGGLLGPVLVVCLEPDRPLARVVASQQPGQPGGLVLQSRLTLVG